MKLKRLGLDTSKAVFTVHGVDHDEKVVLRRNIRRAEMEAFFAKLPPTHVALEACGGSHHWGRRLAALGHTVQLIPPHYVKPFVRRGKNDRNDAEAISEAASRPGMPGVPVKAPEQQAEAIVLSARELLVRQRTQLVNAVRGHAAEFGIVAAKGTSQLPALLEAVAAEAAVPDAAKEMLAFLGAQVAQLDERIAELEQRMKRQHKANAMSKALAEVPGIGPIGALSLALTIDPGRFTSGRHFAAWLGLTPKEHSTGGRQRLGGISRAGNERLRQLLVLGATAVIRYAKPGSKTASAWLLALLERKPRKLAAVALANKMARIVWAIMATGEAYRGNKAAAMQAAESAAVA
jgi:transposase